MYAPIGLNSIKPSSDWPYMAFYRSKATLVTGAFTISHTKCQKRAFGDILGAFGIFLYVWSQRPIDPSPSLE
jgi:hypothetical protein